jgi:mannan endo-1,4-beta-mannosidase
MSESPNSASRWSVANWLSVVAMGLVLSASGCFRPTSVPHAGAQTSSKMMKAETRLEPMDVNDVAERSGHFVLDGKAFCFAGTNNYYLTFKRQTMVDDVLHAAKEMRLPVIRFWGYIDRGSLDGSRPSSDGDGTKDGVYFQYWNSETNQPVFNEDPKTGLPRLDYVLTKCRELGLKAIVVLTNNWKDFGGMDQYVLWYKKKHHHEFYTDPEIKTAYKNWVTYLIGRNNSIDGMPLRDDPAIFAWELANEPRAINYESHDSSSGWDKTTITKWADEMSAHIKSLDPNHMVAVGDEGFLTTGGHWLFEGAGGVDHAALTALPNIDFGTFHLYPDNWSTGLSITTRWIDEHLEVARQVGKPTILEEYGLAVGRNDKNQITTGWERREFAYKHWNEMLLRRGAAGSMFWILSGIDDQRGGLYPDYDHYTVYNGDRTHQLLAPYFQRYQTEAQACRHAPEYLGIPSPFVRATRNLMVTGVGGARSELLVIKPTQQGTSGKQPVGF